MRANQDPPEALKTKRDNPSDYLQTLNIPTPSANARVIIRVKTKKLPKATPQIKPDREPTGPNHSFKPTDTPQN
jgi:hypothetical protein